MANSAARFVFFFLILLAAAAVPCLGTSYTVGNSAGWALGVDYSTWTSDKTFNVGDNLVFNYRSGDHTVYRVSAADYGSCSIANPISADDSGVTTIILKTYGRYYFICGAVGHCSNGMKLTVDVAGSKGNVSA